MRSSDSNQLKQNLSDIFESLASSWPEYSSRKGQVELAINIESVMESGATGIFEAGTGTGKTLSYLVPAFLAKGSVIISTGTKNLQDQLFLRDIPTVRDVRVGRRFTIGAGYEAGAPDAADFMIALAFDDRDGLQTYLRHPAHQELGERFGQALSSGMVYDFEEADLGDFGR